MLVLKSYEGTKYYLTTKSEHTVGRYGSDSDIVICNDVSISRKHASFRILVKKCQLHVEVCDTGSKHGTFVNEGIEQSKEIPKNTKISLNLKDRIRFGLRLSVWTLEEEPLLICIASFTTEHETLMKKLFTKVKGSIVSEWSKKCTHLTTNEIRNEIGVVCALAYLKPIVTFDYWKQLLAALTSRREQPIPNCQEFIPAADDALRRLGKLDFSVNPSRRVLFRNHQFVAYDEEQVESLLPIVEAAGGKIVNGTTTKLSLEQLTSKNVIVLQAKNDRHKKAMGKCLDALKKQRKRAVSETEISMSIIYASKDRYCNPAYDVKTLFNNETPVTMNDDTVLVDDSQNVSEAFTEIQSNFSLAINDQNRAFSDVDDDFVVQNSPPIFEESSVAHSGLKRRLEESPDKPSMKNPRLDFVVTGEKNDDKMDRSQTVSSKSSTSTKEDSFCFQNNTRAGGRSSRSLFAGVKDRVIPNSNVIREKSSAESSSSLIPDSQQRSVQENTQSEHQSRRSSRSLFAKSRIESPDMASASSFSNRGENNSMLGKRKAPDHDQTSPMSKHKLLNVESKPSTSKQQNRSSSLFESSQRKKKGKIIALDHDDEMDSPENPDPSVLKISPRKSSVSLPVVQVPTTVDLSQFMDANSMRNKIKQESDLDISSEIKDMLDKTVLHSVSMVTAKSSPILERVDDSRPNFKKFRKNRCSKPQSIIPITSLILFKMNIKDEI